MIQKPIIIVSNDDGYRARGIDALLHFIAPAAAAAGARVIVFAPEEPQSGRSSAITHDGPVTLRALPPHPSGAEMNAVGGTPVDCVKLALHILRASGESPALVVSGINHGSNSAVSVTYSGTMGCAIEGATNGIPSVGFSLLDWSPDADFSPCRKVVENIMSDLLARPLPPRVCLNVNIPAGKEPEGVKLTEGARGFWTEEYREYADPHGRPFFWLTGHFHNIEPDNPATDEYWLARGWATVVPICVDMGVGEDERREVINSLTCFK